VKPLAEGDEGADDVDEVQETWEVTDWGTGEVVDVEATEAMKGAGTVDLDSLPPVPVRSRAPSTPMIREDACGAPDTPPPPVNRSTKPPVDRSTKPEFGVGGAEASPPTAERKEHKSWKQKLSGVAGRSKSSSPSRPDDSPPREKEGGKERENTWHRKALTKASSMGTIVRDTVLIDNCELPEGEVPPAGATRLRAGDGRGAGQWHGPGVVMQ
jgi:hypothetical protein